jgi:hypothetical protein
VGSDPGRQELELRLEEVTAVRDRDGLALQVADDKCGLGCH